jgi:hypothetical protein
MRNKAGRRRQDSPEMRVAKWQANGSRILGVLRTGRNAGQREQEARHRREWPELWEALDDLVDLADETDPVSRSMRGEWSPRGMTGDAAS